MLSYITYVLTSVLIFLGAFLSSFLGYLHPQIKVATVIPTTATTSTKQVSKVVSVPPPHVFTTAQVISNGITITAPATGTTVVPGQTLQVSVSVAAGTTFSAIQVIGEDIGIAPPKQSPPYSFGLKIPNNIIGAKKITALGLTSTGEGVFSQSIVVDVENSAPLTDVNVEPPELNFIHVGDQVNLTVIGKFGDGTELDVTHSSNTSYQTNDATVATVSTDGVVTAAGVGTTGIIIKYGGRVFPVPVSVQ